MTPKAQYLGTPTMAIVASYRPKPCRNPKITTQTHFSCPSLLKFITPATPKIVISDIIRNPETKAALVGVGVLLSFAGPAFSMQLDEPANALSLPTWAIHVSSVLEWIAAMALVWQYGERSGYESWKGLSWGMVPLLGGALCACTWHFFYNSESLEVLVALQAALTVMGNATMCIAAYRIYKSREGSKNF